MKYSNYVKEKEELQNQLNLLVGFLSFTTSQIDFQKIHFEITYLVLKLERFDDFFSKNYNYRINPKFETLESSMNIYCNTQPFENLLKEKNLILKK